MNWPQYAVVAWMAATLYVVATERYKDERVSAMHVTYWIMGTVFYLGLFAYVLHRGGFW